ncbi:unnamed protein product [Meloidogyne enterolobii]|uniref:Uncharacterized protein n=1 Tax=Meloidogyne enterolobii TaxID=390850 RepID=A0ACB1AI20_MELEN
MAAFLPPFRTSPGSPSPPPWPVAGGGGTVLPVKLVLGQDGIGMLGGLRAMLRVPRGDADEYIAERRVGLSMRLYNAGRLRDRLARDNMR